MENDIINYYCFNKQCGQAIFYPQTCVIKELQISAAIHTPPNCGGCGQAMVSKPMLRWEKTVSDLLTNDSVPPPATPFVSFPKRLAGPNRSSTSFSLSTQLRTTYEAIQYLVDHKDERELIPEFICIDRDVSYIDCWEFLEAFSAIAPVLAKEVAIYVICGHIGADDYERIKKYTAVKGLILKSHGINFLYHSPIDQPE